MAELNQGQVAKAARRSRTSEVRRNRILEAAAMLFADHGFSKTPVEEIATIAGVSKGLVYTHFESKDALLEAVVERAVSEWTRVTNKGAFSAGTAMGTITEGLRASVAHAAADPILHRILGQDQRDLLATLRRKHRAQMVERYIAGTRLGLELAIKAGEIRSDIDLDHIAKVIWLIHDGLVREIAAPGQISSSTGEDATALVDDAVNLFLNGLLVEA